MNNAPTQTQDLIAELQAQAKAEAGGNTETPAPPATPIPTDPALTNPAPATGLEDPKAAHQRSVEEGRIKVQAREYDARIAALEADNNALRANDQARQDELDTLRTATPTPSLNDLLTEDERDMPEVISLVEKGTTLATEATLAKVDQVNQRLDEQEAQNAAFAKEQFWNAMDARLPGWANTNEEMAFKTWLSGVDLMSGQIRNDLLNDAADRNDVNRTVSIFEQYTRETSGGAALTPSVASQASPPTQAGGVTPEKPTYTMEQIQEMMERKNSRQVSSSAELEALTKEINSAIAEGRVSG